MHNVKMINELTQNTKFTSMSIHVHDNTEAVSQRCFAKKVF